MSMTLPLADAALFDMDGLLLDTERLSLETFLETCDSYHLGEQRELFMTLIGSNEVSLCRLVNQAFEGQFDAQVFRSLWFDRYQKRIANGEVSVKLGAEELLQWLCEQGVKCAVATSSTTMLASRKLSDTGLISYFQEIVGGDQVEHGKPDPEIYLKAASLINADYTRTLVFEDSSTGVRSGVAAGFTVFQIPDLLEPTPELLQLGHRVCTSLHEALDVLKRGEFDFSPLSDGDLA